MTNYTFTERTKDFGPSRVKTGFHTGQYEVHVGPIEGTTHGDWDDRFVQCSSQGEVKVEKNVRRLHASGAFCKSCSWAWIDGELYYLAYWYPCVDSMCLLFYKADKKMKELNLLQHGVQKIKSRRKRKQAWQRIKELKKSINCIRN
jgi:hypothetical protein